MRDKILPIEDLKKNIEKSKENGLKIVFTNGCFDILHTGHVHYLIEAKKKGDILVVGLNSDSSVQRLKGEKHPLIKEDERAELLSYLEMVDYIVIFEELTAENIISIIKPDIYVKGGDYQIEELPEAEIVKKNGGKVKLVSHVEGMSTTNIILRILERYKP